MEVIENQVSTGAVLLLDGKYFVNCRFVQCTLIFCGGDFSWKDTHFERCNLQFEGPAMRTVNFLQAFNLLSPRFQQPQEQPPPTNPGERVQ